MHEVFEGPPGPRWQRFVRGRGYLEPEGGCLRLVTQDATCETYSDAQIDDYQGRPRRSFLWRPPLVLTVRGRFSPPPILGTAGFGLWNDPFLMTGLRLPALPRALWFFYGSSPSDMKLDLRTPGRGWKAATLDAARWPARLLLPLAPLAIPLMRIPSFYRRAWPLAQAALHVCEAAVPAPMTEWHTYVIEWGRRSARFLVDGDTVLDCPYAPAGPLGLVLWIDNQYLVATPQGRFRWGLLDAPGRQWLELAGVSVDVL